MDGVGPALATVTGRRLKSACSDGNHAAAGARVGCGSRTLRLVRAIRRFTVRTVLPQPIAALGELASNLRWSWHRRPRSCSPRSTPALGSQPARPGAAAGRAVAGAARRARRGLGVRRRASRRPPPTCSEYLTAPRWYQRRLAADAAPMPAPSPTSRPEFGITEVLPQYSGGLGHPRRRPPEGGQRPRRADRRRRAALPARATSSRRSRARAGSSRRYPVLDPNGLPLALLREADGRAGGRHARPARRPARCTRTSGGAQVGRVPLLLLDTRHRGERRRPRATVTDRLYGGGGEHRLRQEMLLGIGGVRALRVWSPADRRPDARGLPHQRGPRRVPRARAHPRARRGRRARPSTRRSRSARAGTVFTTHTPVPAGIDRFGRDADRAVLRRRQRLARRAGRADPRARRRELRRRRPERVQHGRHGPAPRRSAPTACPCCTAQVSREMFARPVAGLRRRRGADRRRSPTACTRPPGSTRASSTLADAVHRARASTLDGPAAGSGVDADPGRARSGRVRRQLRGRPGRGRPAPGPLVVAQARAPAEAELGWVDDVLDPDVLTIGFARRVPDVQAAHADAARPRPAASRCCSTPTRPVQIVIAGKSHPADDSGKRLIQQMVRFADDPAVRHRDRRSCRTTTSAMAQTLYPGCDVWLNNPLRPLEACGTSGMKAALNGGLNLSILDGWWDEWYDGENGWAIPTADGVDDPDHRDDLEAAALYDLIENSRSPRGSTTATRDGLPARWIEMVRHTLRVARPQGARHPHGRATTCTSSTCRRRRPAQRASVDYAALGVAAFKDRVRSEWHGVRVDHVESLGRRRLAAGGRRDPGCGRSCRSAQLAPRDVDVQLVLRPGRRPTRSPTSSTAPLAHAEELEPGRLPVRGDGAAAPHAGPSATRCASCRPSRAPPRRPSWPW